MTKKRKKSKNGHKTFVSVQGIKGNQKNISTLNEYIKFKLDDFKNNEKDYENNMRNNQQKCDYNIKELNKENKTSYYYFKCSSYY